MSSRTRFVLSAIIAVGMLMLSYWVTNQRFIISGETLLIREVELVRGFFQPHINPMADSVLLINVAYDKELAIDTAVNKGLGYEGITDRKKLFELLSGLKRQGDYRYILLDVLFTDNIHTPEDSALFSLIASMDRIVVPRDINSALADTCLYGKAGLVNYFTNYKFVSFTKYPYLVDGKASLPLKMYEEITGHTITDHGLFATDGWRLARQSIVLPFVLRCDSAYTKDGYKVWYNMGMDLLGSTFTYYGDTITGKSQLYNNPAMFQGNYSKDYQGVFRGKYIVIGAFSGGDMHYSYLENQPGPAILFNAYLSLLHRHHIVSPWIFLLLLAAFFYMSWCILNNKTIDMLLSSVTQPKTKSKAVVWRAFTVIISWVGYSLFLSFLCVFTYLVMGEVYDIFITATVFQLISIAVARIRNYKTKIHHA